MSRPIEDLEGRQFGRWLVLKMMPHEKYKKVRWLCVCDCGTEQVVRGDQLKSGISRSCGCLAKEVNGRRTHGHASRRGSGRWAPTVEYNCWQSMKQRCNNKSNLSYAAYGGRGIRVCRRWEESFEAFLEDMGFRPGDEYSIDRIDPNGDYDPSNCRWATRQQQAENLRRTYKITYNGVTDSLSGWSRRTGLGTTTIRQRLKKGWPLSVVLSPGSKHSWARRRRSGNIDGQ